MTQQNYDFDLFTIGGGSGGVRASRFAAQYGARVALAENQYLGGTCVNVGCIPKKLLSYAAHYHDDLKDAAGFGWEIGEAKFDWRKLIADKDGEITRLNRVYSKILSSAGVTTFNGHATVEDAHTVIVNGQRITSRYILIATGGRPTWPEIPGKELGMVSDDFFHMKELPVNAIVAGGGYIAVELAAILNGLGTKVTLVHRGSQILRGMDADLGKFLTQEMLKKGIDVRCETKFSSIEMGKGEKRHVSFDNGDKLDVDAVIFATGRHANTEDMGLEAAGVTLTANGGVEVGENFRTSVPSIYAVGDVINRVALTPVALAEGMVVASALFDSAARQMSYVNIPTAVFSHPNVSTVGMTEDAARKKYGKIKVFKSDFKALKHTISGSKERVFMKLIVDEASDVVVGVHMVGADAGEIIQGFAVALQSGATKAQFDSTIGVHPTIAEELVTMRTSVEEPE